jgi:hypothetical protein
LNWLQNRKQIKPQRRYVEGDIMTDKGLSTRAQESKGKFTTPIPTALVNLLGIEKGNKLIWNLNNGEITIKVVKA